MRLENLYPNFGLASPEAQAEYITSYRLRRAEDMDKPSTWPKKKAAAKSAKQAISPPTEEEKVLMKLLGLKKKDIISLRALSTEED